LFFDWVNQLNQIKEAAMNEETGQAPAQQNEQPVSEPSPTEKLEGDPPPGSIIPGAQNPESTEIITFRIRSQSSNGGSVAEITRPL
jgi:hypothetical protein